MARILKPLVRGGGYYPSKKWIPLVKNGGYTTQNGGETEPVWATASGAIASFTTPFAYPLKSLVAQINPVQDLHGYDSPWPAGGGKNKFPYATIEGQGNILLKQPAPISAGSYIVSCVRNTNTGYFSLVFYDASDNQVGSTTLYLNNTNAVALTLSADATKVTCYAPQQMSVSNVQIEAGSSATSYQPYSNICPISGHTGLSVEVTGFNVWDEEWEVGKLNATTGQPEDGQNIRSKNFIPIIEGKSYYWSCTAGNAVMVYDADKNFIRPLYFSANSVMAASNFAGGSYIKFYAGVAYGTTYNHDISINYPSTDTSYHAYTGEPISVSWQDEAGTVYGGSDEVVGGELTSTMGEVDLGTLDWTYDSANARFYTIGLRNVIMRGASGWRDWILCSSYKSAIGTNEDKVISQYASTGYIYLKDTAYADATAFKNALNGVQLVYPLATPQTFTHDSHQIDTLLGQNNVWHDANGDIEVTYRIG